MEILMDKIFAFNYNTGDVFENVSFDGYELTFFLNGTGTMASHNEVISYKANNIFFSTPDYKRKLVCLEHTNYLCIRFYTNTPITDLKRGIYHCSNDELFNLMKLIFKEYKDKPYRYFDYCNTKVLEILILLSRQIAENKMTDQNIHDLIKKIDESLSFDFSVGEMADMLNYNYDYFRQKFKGITGQSPTNYIANKRIENACVLLKKNTYSCTEISNLCGFSSPSQFSKLFKQEVGITPLSYQKNAR
ncbi:MAG: AraC family transcriptional regulator [Lachnospiraceae bacterium]